MCLVLLRAMILLDRLALSGKRVGLLLKEVAAKAEFPLELQLERACLGLSRFYFSGDPHATRDVERGECCL